MLWGVAALLHNHTTALDLLIDHFCYSYPVFNCFCAGETFDSPSSTSNMAAAGSGHADFSKSGFGTKVLHCGQEPDATTGAVAVPISMSTTFAQVSPGIASVRECGLCAPWNPCHLHRVFSGR